MTTGPNPIDALPRHTISYQIMTNMAGEDTERSFEVYASPEEIEQFGKQGYLVRKGLFSDEQLQQYRDALDEVEAAEVTKERIGRSGILAVGSLAISSTNTKPSTISGSHLWIREDLPANDLR